MEDSSTQLRQVTYELLNEPGDMLILIQEPMSSFKSQMQRPSYYRCKIQSNLETTALPISKKLNTIN